MFVFITQTITLPTGTYQPGQLVEICHGWFNRNAMTDIGIPTAAQLGQMQGGYGWGGTTWAQTNPTIPIGWCP